MTLARISTPHGVIAYRDQPAREGAHGVPVLFIHGNSSSHRAFDPQFAATVSAGRRFIALDLPGHGASEDAPDPVKTYAIDGFADAALCLLNELGIEDVVLVGWSLGGHIALELAAGLPGVKGVLITGTPPVGGNPDDMAAAFLPTEDMALTFKADYTEDEVQLKARGQFGKAYPLEGWVVDAIRRADGRFRTQMIEAAMAGRGRDQKEIAATLPVPLAVFHGEADPFINGDYLEGLTYANLWRDSVQKFAGVEHGPFREDAERFNELLSAFLRDTG